MWSGLKADIPSGWALCDGSLGTPDLRNRFIYGVGDSEEAGGVGGSEQHDHDAHPIQSHSGVSVQNHPALPHAGCAVADHASQSHIGTAVADHAGKNVGVADVGATQRGTTTSTLTLKAHVHPISAYTHEVTQPSAHPALSHNVTQPNDHPAQSHVVTQPNDHPQLAHGLEDHKPPYFKLCFIMKL